METNVNLYKMRLPRGYVDLSAEELEYDGSNKEVPSLEPPYSTNKIYMQY
jgi:hypothetical protein